MLAFVISVPGQPRVASPCTMTIAKSPTLFGFKLGMSQAESEKITGRTAKEDYILLKGSGDRFVQYPTGNMSITIFNFEHDSTVVDATAESLSLSFMDGKLFEIFFSLNSTSDWVKATDTAAFFQKKFGIPAGAWFDDPKNREEGERTASCNGVTIDFATLTSTSGTPMMRFTISETTVRARVDAAREAAKEKHNRNN